MAIEAALYYMILSWDHKHVSSFIRTEKMLREDWVSKNLDKEAQSGYDSVMNRMLSMAKRRESVDPED